MPHHNICLLFSDTGGGHRSAVEAIEAGIGELTAESSLADSYSVLSDNVAEKSHPINRWFVDLYNYMLRYQQSRMKYYYWFIQNIKPNDSAIGYRLVRPYLNKLLDRLKPSVVVSVHPMTNHYMARVLAERNLTGHTRLISVVTDPNSDLWRGWGCAQADLIIAPNELARDRLLSWGVPGSKIALLGMPVHPDFLRVPRVPRATFLSLLGLSSTRFTVVFNAGWAGGGNLLPIYQRLAAARRPLQCIFVCGHNRNLFQLVCNEAKAHPAPTAVLPFHDSMPDLMSACDAMVTKAGGLTTFEAVARRLPMAFDLITPAMPQEAGTCDLVVEQGLGYRLHRSEDLVALVDGAALTIDLDRAEKPLPSAYCLDRTHAVYDIAATILAACDPSWDGKPVFCREKPATRFTLS